MIVYTRRQWLPKWPVKRGEIHLLYPSGRHLSPRVRLLVELIVEWFANRATGSAR